MIGLVFMIYDQALTRLPFSFEVEAQRFVDQDEDIVYRAHPQFSLVPP